MTVGIGAMCDLGRCIVLGSDTRASYDPECRLPPNDRISKVYPLPHEFVMRVAETLHECHSVSAQVAIELEKLRGNFEVDHVGMAIDDARFYELKHIADHQIRIRFGLTLSEWQQLPKNAAVYRGGRAIFRGIHVDVETIVAGFLNRTPDEIPNGSTNAFLFRALSKNRREMENNYATIGSGGHASRMLLDRCGQNVGRSWQRTSVDIIRAILAAQRSNRQSVGPPADLLVMWSGQRKKLPVRHPDVVGLVEKLEEQGNRRESVEYNHFDPRIDRLLESLLDKEGD